MSTRPETPIKNEDASTHVGRWLAREQRVAALLPGQAAHDRARLLIEISSYAEAVLREARDTYDKECQPAVLKDHLWLRSPVFICGCLRSGTTLLQQLLDGHPELLVLPSEGTYLTSFRYVAHAKPTREDLDRFLLEWIARFISPNERPHFKLGVTTAAGNPNVLFCRRFFAWYSALISSDRAEIPFASLLALVASYKDVVAPAGMPSMWVEKTPLNEFNVRRLRAAFPNARFIHMLRDPRFALASLRTAYGPDGAGEFFPDKEAARLAGSLRLAARYKRSLAGRYLTVRYEDLAAHPEREMSRVRDFLVIEASNSLLTPTVGNTPTPSNSSFITGPAGVIHPPRVQNPLSSEEERFMAALLGDIANKHGYHFAAPHPLTRWKTRARVKFNRGKHFLARLGVLRDR